MVFPSRPQRSLPSRQPRQMFPNQQFSNKMTSNSKQGKGWQPLIAKGVNGVSKTLGNVQQVLNVVQSTTPFIQQYGPMVKNIPSMYRMIKAFKDVDNSDKPDADKKEKETQWINQKSSGTKDENAKQDVLPKQRTNSDGQSTPKLFI